MEWQDWLEKTEPTGLTARQKKLAKEIADGDKDDHTQYYTKNDVNKILGAIGGAIAGAGRAVGQAAASGVKGLAAGTKGNSPTGSSTGQIASTALNSVDNLVEDVKNENQTGVSKAWETWLEKNDPCWEGYEQYGMKDKEGKKVPNCIKKNNAIETSHKEGEKKEEWNGKFDNSTTRDDAENDDDKAIGEEESLEELTDGKLEEVEKLKSWEIFLDKMGEGGTEEDLPHEEGEIAGKKDMHSLTGRYQNPIKHKKGHFANTITGKDAVEGTKKIPTSRTGTFQDTKNTKNLTENDVTAGAVRTAKKYPELKQYVPEAQVVEDKGLGGDTDKPVKTQEELDKEFYERTQPEPKGTKSDKKVLARRKRKSWELFLEKGITYEDTNPRETDPEKIMESAKNPRKKITLTPDMKKSWNEWLEKMQGAGDARFGNQHLTGMEQKPVADDESIELSAESDKNNEKQEKTEDKEDKDNKPYKALSQE